MGRLFRRNPSPQKQAAKLEKNLQKAIAKNNQSEAITSVVDLFNLYYQEKQAVPLANVFLTYGSKIDDFSSVEKQISTRKLKQIVNFLETTGHENTALLICKKAGYDTEAINLFAKQDRTNDLIMYISQGESYLNKELFGEAITSWEKHHGDIRKSPRMGQILANTAKFSPESIPNNPRAKELAGQYQEAAVLYIEKQELFDAARCYEQAEAYDEAYKIYEVVGDHESASKAAEANGDFDNALRLVINPERKVQLLIQTERFLDAREFATGLSSPQPYFELIQQQAKKRMDIRIQGHDYIGALALADLAECNLAEKEDLLSHCRQQFDQQIASAKTDEDIKEIYRARLELEENAGNFVEAARIAEEVLGELDLASFLYEKANLFDRALNTAPQHAERLAELHEKGGNLLKAAKLYEEAEQFEKAYVLYNSLQNYDKAIEFYLKTDNPRPDTLIHLYTKSGQFEKVIEIYMNSGTFLDLEKALAVASTNKLTSHIRILEEKIAAATFGNTEDLEQFYEQAKTVTLRLYGQTIGIDFGTTNSVVAIFNKDTKKIEIVLTPKGKNYLPSYFGVDEDNHPIFGETAFLRSLTTPNCVVARVKRSLGDKKIFFLGRKPYSSEEVVAHLLQHLIMNAEIYLASKVEAKFRELLHQNDLNFSTEILNTFLNQQQAFNYFQDVVLSVPAYFNDSQKRATRDAAEIAGLHVRRLLHEPSAAALAYAYRKKYTGKIAVIDLGGGTLDISIVDIGDGVSEVRTISGDIKLGGSDIDELLVQHAVNNIQMLWGVHLSEDTHPIEITRLRDACEQLKINLSTVKQYTIELPHFLNKPSYTLSFSRAELENLSKPILERIEKSITTTLSIYGSTIDNYILVGNATKMPAVNALVKRIVHAEQLAGIDPGTVVAMGTVVHGAVLAGESNEILLLDAVPYSLGIAAIKDSSQTETISTLIDKNTTIPVNKSSTYSTKTDNQTSVHIRVYQGESLTPENNYFLGDFILEGIPPAPANTPKIEVTFDISTDCILTVTARDKETGNKRSVKIERAVGLSYEEKQNLRDFFERKKQVYTLETELARERLEIESVKKSCEAAIETAVLFLNDFSDQFHEKLEVNPHFYETNSVEHISEIQNMFIQKDQLLLSMPKYQDQLTSILKNIEQIQAKHLDFSHKDIPSKLNERIYGLKHYKQSLADLQTSIEDNVSLRAESWILILESMEPDEANMNPLETASYHLAEGRVQKAREILEGLESGELGLTKESFNLLLKCYISLGLKEEYRDVHKRLGHLFGLNYPDFYRLNTYLKAIDESVFMIHAMSDQQSYTGSGFCIAPHLLVTNRHVIENADQQNIRIVGKKTSYMVERLIVDSTDDLAILQIRETLKPLRLGAFNFVEPGESVMALGFPSPDSPIPDENIYISKGIVNSIRKVDSSSKRVIFVDTKFRAGMSGGPLINELGEVVGIVTHIQVHDHKRSDWNNVPFAENQPVALPIDLVKKYLNNQ